MAGINFKAFDLGGHEIARRVWKDYYAKVCTIRRLYVNLTQLMLRHVRVLISLHACMGPCAAVMDTHVLYRRH